MTLLPTIVLNTKVVLEFMRPNPEPRVLRWLDSHSTSDLCVTTVTPAEILTGIAIMPEGRRRRGLQAAAEHTFAARFAQLVLTFNRPAASACATIFAARSTGGRPISQSDRQIVSIARSRGEGMATRGVGGLESCGVELINPRTVE